MVEVVGLRVIAIRTGSAIKRTEPANVLALRLTNRTTTSQSATTERSDRYRDCFW